jgi:hypothetical protein
MEEGGVAGKLVEEVAMTHSEMQCVFSEGVPALVVEEVAMTHSEMQCVFSEGVPALVAEAVLHFVGQENLFE